ncbi:hypothetical protein [Flavobacterium sp. FlaQc-28]|uniref:hypothetical protein n=1 Tax=Flavobacterium sp. FlaQc-28 TaxID=3374178 RepID=UPI0037563710
MSSCSKKIVIIDSDEMTTNILKFILTNEGYEINIAKDAIDALKKNTGNNARSGNYRNNYSV